MKISQANTNEIVANMKSERQPLRADYLEQMSDRIAALEADLATAREEALAVVAAATSDTFLIMRLGPRAERPLAKSARRSPPSAPPSQCAGSGND